MSSKNRKKQLRKITVEGEIFHWSVTDTNHDGDGGSNFRIWKNKHLIVSEVVTDTITPKYVADKINVLKSLGAQYKTKGVKEKV